jgi:hypothetical protein
MKFFIFSLIITLIYCPPAYTTMEALDNESLSKVKGSDENKSNQDTVTDESKISLGKENKQKKNLSEASPLDSKLKTLHESSEYKKFMFYLNKLEQFAYEEDYSQLATSDKFIFFCSSFAETAKKCSDQLALFADVNSDDKIKNVLIAKSRIFYKADDFYNNLLLYKKGTATLPDLKGLIDEIKKCQRTFESMYANIN